MFVSFFKSSCELKKSNGKEEGRQIGDRSDSFGRQLFFSTRHGDQNGRSLERW